MRHFLLLTIILICHLNIYGQRPSNPNEIWINQKDGMTYVFISDDSFIKEVQFDSLGSEMIIQKKTIFNEGFWMSQSEVTFDHFKKFVKETGYITDAEKRGDKFTWKKSKFNNEQIQPVKYLSHKDALAYAEWAGVDIPLKTEWIFDRDGEIWAKIVLYSENGFRCIKRITPNYALLYYLEN